VREFRHFIDDMLDAIDGIEKALDGKSFEEYQSDWLLRLATQRGIEIISEASRRLPSEAKALRTDIPWQRVSAIGNVLRHEYDSLADQVLWGVMKNELTILRAALIEIERSFQP
jgi:uncharacterized protein with HEPN domain